jgi:hypothetical protein
LRRLSIGSAADRRATGGVDPAFPGRPETPIIHPWPK